MPTCDACETAISGPGHFVVDGDVLCRRCRNQRKTTSGRRAPRTSNPHAAKRSRERVITNEVGR